MALLPDVVLRREPVPVLIDDAVVAVVTVTILGEPAEGVHLVAVPVLRLEIVVDDALEGLANGELGGVAGREPARRTAARDVAEDEAQRIGAVRRVDDLRGREDLRGDVEVTAGLVVDGRVRIARVFVVVGERVELDPVEPRGEREAVEVVRVGHQVLRPVDAEVLALVPGPVRRVLDDDVELLAGLRVVVADDVEVARDVELGDDLSVVGRLRAVVIAVLHALVGETRDENVLLDLPLDARERTDRLVEEEVLPDAVGLIDDAIAHVKLGVVRVVAQARADEEVLRERHGLHAVDGRALLGATGGDAEDPGDQRGDTKEAKEPRAHPVLLRTARAPRTSGRARRGEPYRVRPLPVSLAMRRGAVAPRRPARALRAPRRGRTRTRRAPDGQGPRPSSE